MTNHSHLDDQAIENILNQALNKHPIAPLPAGFMQRVMGQILPQPEPFRIAWQDVAWSLAISLVMGLIILFILNLTGRADFPWMPNISVLWRWADWSGSPWVLRSFVMVSAELVIGLAIYIGFAEDYSELI